MDEKGGEVEILVCCFFQFTKGQDGVRWIQHPAVASRRMLGFGVKVLERVGSVAIGGDMRKNGREDVTQGWMSNLGRE